MAFAPPPKPKNGLGYYRLLSPTASVRVSPLCLGAMNFGESWKDFMGECGKETALGILDFFYENGGNFIDTANNYQKGESEQYIGEWMKKRGNREQMVIATKYTTPYRTSFGDKEIIVNTGGSGSKSLHVSIENSLKNLQVSYIDLLYVHWWDYTTSIPELMQSLNQLVLAGKVIYLGASDMPAWIVATANQYARDHGMRPFSVYQGRWSAAERDLERDVIPMCLAEGMGIAPWGALGGGKFKSEDQRKSITDGRKFGELRDVHVKVSKVLETLTTKKSTQITSIAMAYVMKKTPYVFPIVGGRNIEHLKGNIEGLSVELSDEDVKEIEGAAPFDLGFPMNVIGVNQETSLNAIGGHHDWVAQQKPITPHKWEGFSIVSIR